MINTKKKHLIGKEGEMLAQKILKKLGLNVYRPREFFRNEHDISVHSRPDYGVDYIATDGENCYFIQVKNSSKEKREVSNREIDKFLDIAKHYETLLKGKYENIHFMLMGRGDVSNQLASHLMKHNVDNFIYFDMNIVKNLNDIGKNTSLKDYVKVFSNNNKYFENDELLLNIYNALNNGNGTSDVKIRELYKHQRDAIEFIFSNIRAGYKRFTLAMATGTGKTLTYVRNIIESVKRLGYRNFIILSPSVSLIAQTLKTVEYELKAHNMRDDFEILCVTHDKTVSTNSDDDIDLIDFINENKIKASVTTDINAINDFLNKSYRKRKIVISTYQSLDKMIMAISEVKRNNSSFMYDIAVMDEAHWTAGVVKKDNKGMYKKVHEDKYLPAHVRIYCTGTTVVYKTNNSKLKNVDGVNDNLEDDQIYSMDDPYIYGLIYRYTLRQAIIDGILTDYRIVTFYTLLYNKYKYSELIEKLVGADIKYEFLSMLVIIDALKNGIKVDLTNVSNSHYNNGNSAYYAKNLDSGHVIEEVQNKTGILTVNSRKKAKLLKKYFDELKSSLGFEDVEIEYILGEEKHEVRKVKMDWLAKQDGKIKIMINVRVMNEGIDIPSLGFIGFLEEKSSVVDILQILGRVLRKHDSKKYAYVFVPLLVEILSEDFQEQYAINEDTYGILINILDAVRSIDQFEYVRDRLIHARNVSDKIYAGSVDYSKEYNLIIKNMNDVINTVKERLVDNMSYKSLKLNKRIVEYISERVNNLFEIIKKDILMKANSNESFKAVIEDLKKQINKIKSEYSIQVFSEDLNYDGVINLMCLNIIMPDIFSHYIDLDKDPIYVSINKVFERYMSDYIKRYREEVSNNMQYIKNKMSEINNEIDRLDILRNLFEGLFNSLFKKEMGILGAVYTPAEVVKFMVYLSAHMLMKYFDKSILDKDVFLVDLFAGTGTIVSAIMHAIYNEANEKGYDKSAFARMIEDYKVFGVEIHYIAYFVFKSVVNTTFKMIFGREPLKDIAMLGDTFKMQASQIESKGIDNLFSYNKELNRKIRDFYMNGDFIKLIVTNSPFGNINDKNIVQLVYNELNKYNNISEGKRFDNRYLIAIVNEIANTKRGIITAVIPNDFLYTNYGRIFKNYLEKNPKVRAVRVLNLRGNAYKVGEDFKKEGGKIFGEGSRLGICVISIVIDANAQDSFEKEILYYEVEDYMTREEKLNFLKEKSKTLDIEYKRIYAKDGIWILEDTNNDFVEKSRQFYEKKMYNILPEGKRNKIHDNKDSNYVFNNSYLGLISGDDEKRYENISYKKDSDILECLYRPFYKKGINRSHFSLFNLINKQNINVFPLSSTQVYDNKLILIGDLSSTILCTDRYYDNGAASWRSNFIGIPLYTYNLSKNNIDLFNQESGNNTSYVFEHNVNKAVLKTLSNKYKTKVTAEDVFFYTIAYLNNPEYKERFGYFVVSNKPKIGFVDEATLFYKLVNIGKVIYNILTNYESVEDYDVEVDIRSNPDAIETYLLDKDVKVDSNSGIIYYNKNITIKVPLDAFKYKLRDRDVYSNMLRSDSVKNMNEVIRNTKPDYFISLIKKVTTVAIKMNEIRERLREMKIFDEIE